MRKRICKKIGTIIMSLSVVALAGLSGTNMVNAATKTNYCTVKKGKSLWVGPSHAGFHPATTNWRSSNTGIATVSTKGDSDGGHKVTAKRIGKVTISCTISKTSGSWKKGDVHKWVVTVK